MENIHSEILLQRNISPFNQFMADVDSKVNKKRRVLMKADRIVSITQKYKSA
jgi:hypothetical protein